MIKHGTQRKICGQIGEWTAGHEHTLVGFFHFCLLQSKTIKSYPKHLDLNSVLKTSNKRLTLITTSQRRLFYLLWMWTHDLYVVPKITIVRCGNQFSSKLQLTAYRTQAHTTTHLIPGSSFAATGLLQTTMAPKTNLQILHEIPIGITEGASYCNV